MRERHLRNKLCTFSSVYITSVLQAVETKRVKLNHEGVHKNTEQFYREMKSVVKGADTIPLAVGFATCP